MKQHSRAIACIVLTLCVGSSMGAQIASIWQQCGGTSCPSGVCQDAEWKDTKCAAGLKCFRQSEYYYQCRATAQLYEQCGGLSCQFKGVCADSNWAACTNGHSCVRKSEFYWQCLPANLAQVQSTKATTAASVQSVSSGAKNMRLSQAQLAHVPIPRHSVVHVSSKKAPAEDVAVSVASAAAPARIRPVEEAPVTISEKQPEQVRPAAAAAAAVSTAAIKPATAAAAASSSAAKPSAADAAAGAIKPATIGLPYSTEPTKPAGATISSKVSDDTPVAIASTSSSTAAAKPSAVASRPAAARSIGLPYSSEPTKPAEGAATTVAVASAASKPSAVDSIKPAGAVGMPYSADPTKPGSSSSISTAAVSRAARSEPSSGKKPASASASSARARHSEQDAAAELQWERPALSTASLRHEEPAHPASRRPPQMMMRPQTRARAMDFEKEDEDSQGSFVAAAAGRPAAAFGAPHPQASRLRPARVESMGGRAREDHAYPMGPRVHWRP